MCTPQERDFSLISLSSTSAWYLQQRWYLGRTWSRWRGKKGGKMKARREVGKERQKEGAGEGEWVRREIYVLQHVQLGQFSSPCSWALWQGKEVAASAPAYSPVFSPQGFLMKNSYTNTWSVFTNTAEKQRKMKTGSWFYPRGISPGILGLLSLCELCPPQETSSWQNRDPKKGKKRKPTRPCGVWFPVALFGPCLLSRWWRSWFFQGQAYLLCKFFCQSAPMTMLMRSSGAKQIPGDTFSTMAYADFFASHIHFAIISWLFAIHQALCIITHPFLCNSITGESRSLWLWVMPPSGLLLIWNLLGLLPRYLWRAGRTLEPTGN